MIKIKDSLDWLIFIVICFALVLLAPSLILDNKKVQQISLQDRIETLEQVMKEQNTEMKSRTRPIINIKYGTVYHAEGEIVIEESKKRVGSRQSAVSSKQ